MQHTYGIWTRRYVKHGTKEEEQEKEKHVDKARASDARPLQFSFLANYSDINL
jgi:hypothetical protein